MMRCSYRPTVGQARHGGLLPLPPPGVRVARRRSGGRGGLVVRSHLDAESARQALDAAWSAHPGLRIQLAEIGSQALNFMHGIADEAAVAGAVDAVSSTAGDVGQDAADAAASGGGGFLDGLAMAFTNFLKVIDGGLEVLNVPYSYGFAIIVLTVLVKIATFPLTQKQVESSINMQALQPRMQELQAKYKNDPERIQKETAALYQEAGVNPLSGCLPTLATIPVFIGLYRALLLAADEGLLDDGFFWIPSLAGPTSISARQAGLGLSWLLPFQDGAPPIGWDDATAYLVLPVLLIVSQYISQSIIQQKSDDPSQQSVQTLLKFLPLMLGWFSLNVPSGLTLYWITNNLLSTGQQAYLKGVGKPSVDPQVKSATIVKPPPEVIDVKPSGKRLGSRRSAEQIAAAEQATQERRKSSRGDKFRSRRGKETARKAASLASKQASAQPEIKSMLGEAPPLDLGTSTATEAPEIEIKAPPEAAVPTSTSVPVAPGGASAVETEPPTPGTKGDAIGGESAGAEATSAAAVAKAAAGSPRGGARKASAKQRRKKGKKKGKRR